MFDKVILKDVIEDYKRDFTAFQWKNECYKWEAIQCFQRNWNIIIAATKPTGCS